MISLMLRNRSLRPIGLDIGHSSIKIIQLAMNGGQVSVIAAGKTNIDSDIDGDEKARRDFIVSAIKRMLAEGGFRGRNVVSCLPNERLKITSLRLADKETEQMEQSLKKEVVQRFGLDPDKDAMHYMVAGDVQQGEETKNELILFAADNEAVKSHIELLEEIDLRPVAIDTVPCALFRSFERSLRRQGDRERTLVFVDVGSRFTTVVFGRGGEISFVKQIPLGGETFNQKIAERLAVNVAEAQMLRDKLRAERGGRVCESASNTRAAEDNGRDIDAATRQAIVDSIGSVAEELAKEISLCLRYYTVTFRGKRVERAIFTGGGAYEDILLNVLKRQLTVEIEVGQPLRGFDLSGEEAHINLDSDRRGVLCEWAVAVGLSLKGWNGTKNSRTD